MTERTLVERIVNHLSCYDGPVTSPDLVLLSEAAAALAQAQARIGELEIANSDLKQGVVNLEAVCDRLEKALVIIEQWSEFPPAEWNGQPCSYGSAYGSTGERDYMRGVARAAIKELRSARARSAAQ